MAEWRFLRGWSEQELRRQLSAMQSLERNFDQQGLEEMSDEKGWRAYGSRALVAREPPGPPLDDGPFRLGCNAISARDDGRSVTVGETLRRRSPPTSSMCP